MERKVDEVDLARVVARVDLLALQVAIEDVHVAPSVGQYLVSVVAATRAHPQVEVGASPRATLALLKLCRARAALRGRDFVVPEDVKALAVPGDPLWPPPAPDRPRPPCAPSVAPAVPTRARPTGSRRVFAG